MKKTTLLLILIPCLFLYSQPKNEAQIKLVKVNYKSSLTKPEETTKPNISDLNDRFIKYQESFEFELFFDKSKSIFRLIDNIDLDDQSIEYKITRGLSNEIHYKDLINKEKIKQTTSFDEIFNVIKPFNEYTWEITKETKIIDGYTCYKAICRYETYDDNRKTSLVFSPSVWFAPSLPYPFGPCGLDGLPGLVLEGTFNGRIYFYATKISFDDKTLNKIERPKNGKDITEKDFLKMDSENLKKLNESRQ